MRASRTKKGLVERITADSAAWGLRPAILLTIIYFSCYALADTVLLNNNQKLDGEIRFEEGAITVTEHSSSEREVSLDEIKHLEINPTEEALAAAGWLAPGWSRADIGNPLKSGTAGQGRNTLVIQSGTFKAPVDRLAAGKDFRGHLVYRKISLDGRIEARVNAVDAPLNGTDPDGEGGIIVRASSDPNAPWVHLVVSQNGNITARASTGGGSSIHNFGSTTAKLPCLLSLSLENSSIIASHSINGDKWIPLGSWPLKSSAWSQPEIELAKPAKTKDKRNPPSEPKVQGGFIALGSSTDKTTSVRFTKARFSGRGLLGHYFHGTDFEDLAFNRIDPFLNFDWGSGSPHPDIAADLFSVRWEGYITPKKTAEYLFFLTADDSAAVQIDGEIVNGRFWNEYGKHKPTPKLMEAGKKHRIELSYFERRERGPNARLQLVTADVDEWEKHQRRKSGGENWWDIHLTRGDVLSCEFEALAELPEPSTGSSVAPGIELVDGSFLVGRIASGNKVSIQMVRNDGGRLGIPTSHVTRIRLQPQDMEPVPGNELVRNGLLFAGGDFMEAKFQSVSDGKLRVSSILFGLREFLIDDPRLFEIVIAKSQAQKSLSPFSVETIDGSRYLAKSVVVDEKFVRLEMPLLQDGVIQIRSSQVKVLRTVAQDAKAF